MPDDPQDKIPEVALPTHRPPNKGLLTLALIPIVGILVGGNIALLGFKPLLIKDHPLLLLLVSPSRTFMVLVQARLDAVSYYAVVIVRSLLADPSYYFLGYWFGVKAIGYIKKYTPELGEIATKLEQWFPRFGWLLVLLYPHPLVMVMAGASTMSFFTFITLDFAGVMIGAYLVREFGWLVQGLVDWITRFNAKYWIPLTGVFLLYGAYMIFSARRRGGSFQTPGSIRKELEGGDRNSEDGV